MPYCTNCGKPLMEGEICSCQQPAQPPMMTAQKEEPVSSPSADEMGQAPQNQYDAPEQTPYEEYYGTPSDGQQSQQGPSYGGPQGEGYGYSGGNGQPAGQPLYPGQMPPQQTYQPHQPGKVGIFFRNVGNLISAFFKKPSDMVKAATEHQDVGMGFFFAGVNALFVALFLGVFVSRLGAIMADLMGAGLGSFMGIGMSLPFFPFFLCGLVMAVIGYFLLCGLTFLMGKICKSQVNFKGVLAAMGVSTFPATICILLATILALLIPDWSLYISIAALAFWMMNSYHAARIAIQADDNKTYFLYPLAFIIMFIITSYITFQLLGWAILQISFTSSGLW